MKALTTEVVDRGEKHYVRGRRIAAAEERVALLAAYGRSGLTQREFARREGVKFCTFVSWLACRHRVQGKPAFAEVRVAGGGGTGMIEVALPDGLVVRGSDTEQLVVVVGRLRRC